mgnify:FL=1
MTGFSDSVVFEMNSTILSKLSLFGVVRVAKNGLILDESLLNEFINKRTIKGKSKQLLELKNLYQYLAILETQTGLRYKIMQHKTAKKVNITFQGLKQYTEISQLMEYDLKEFIAAFKDDIQIMRLDVAIDNKEPFNIKAIAENTNRVILDRWNTSYLKTAKEKNTNRHLNIKHYYKQIAELYRLEFVFCKRYFQSKEPFELIEKTIKKALSKPFKLNDEFHLIS